MVEDLTYSDGACQSLFIKCVFGVGDIIVGGVSPPITPNKPINQFFDRGGSDYSMGRIVRFESSGEILGAN